jgi:hypothetical protein
MGAVEILGEQSSYEILEKKMRELGKDPLTWVMTPSLHCLNAADLHRVGSPRPS